MQLLVEQNKIVYSQKVTKVFNSFGGKMIVLLNRELLKNWQSFQLI